MKYTTLISTYGTLTIDKTTGVVLSVEHNSDDKCLLNIARVDVAEYLKYYGVEILPDELDIMDVGTWAKHGGYEPAELEWRGEAKLLDEYSNDCDWVEYKNEKYPTKTFDIIFNDEPRTVTIATDSLSTALGDDKELHGSEEEGIDSTIYFYVPDNIISLSPEIIARHHLDESFKIVNDEPDADKLLRQCYDRLIACGDESEFLDTVQLYLTNKNI